MTCPHCKRSIRLFSRALNTFGHHKTCPHCQGKVRIRVSMRPLLWWFTPIVLLTLLLKPWLGVLANGVSVLLLMLVTIRLAPVNTSA